MTSFLDRIQQLPSVETGNGAFCQIITSPSGMFITKENAEKVGFSPLQSPEWKLMTKEFGSEDVEGYFTQTPRLIILKQSKLGMFREDTGKNGKTFLKFIGDYDGDVYLNDKKNVILKSRFLVIFVDKAGNPIVKQPLNLTVKGGIGYKFANAYNEMRQQAQIALKELTGKNLDYSSPVYQYLIFAPTLAKYQTEFKSTATMISGVEAITAQSFESLHGMSYPATEALVNEILASEPDVEFYTNKVADSEQSAPETDDGFSPRGQAKTPAPQLAKSLLAMVESDEVYSDEGSATMRAVEEAGIVDLPY